MSLVEWSPFRDIENLGREMQSFLRTPFKDFDRYSAPKVDIYQNEKNVIVKAELPGIDKDELNVYVEKDFVQISGQKQRNQEIKEENIYRVEQYYGSFSRTIPLPAEVVSDNANAEYKNGILSIILPKSDNNKLKGKKIQIQ